MAGIHTHFVGKFGKRHSPPPAPTPHPRGETCSSLAGTLICFASCIICQDVTSSRPWKQLQCSGRRWSGGAVSLLRPSSGARVERLATRPPAARGLKLTFFPSKGAQSPCRSSRHARGGSSRLQPNCIASQYETIWAESGQNLTRVQFLLDDFLLPVCSASLSWALQLPPAAHRLPSDTSPLSPVTAKLTPAVLTSPMCIYSHVYTSAYLLPPPPGAEVSTTSSPRLPQTSKWHHSSPGVSGQKPRSQS